MRKIIINVKLGINEYHQIKISRKGHSLLMQQLLVELPDLLDIEEHSSIEKMSFDIQIL